MTRHDPNTYGLPAVRSSMEWVAYFQDNAARLLDVPASTLKSRFTTALNRLRVRLEQLGWSYEET